MLRDNEKNGTQKESTKVFVIHILCMNICIKQKMKILTFKYSGWWICVFTSFSVLFFIINIAKTKINKQKLYFCYTAKVNSEASIGTTVY